MPTVILSQRFSTDSQEVWKAAVAAGWDAHRAIRFGVPMLDQSTPYCVYGELTFADIMARRCDLGLLDPPDDFLPELPFELLQRQVTLLPVYSLPLFTQRAFFKPANDKFFHRGVFERGTDVPVRHIEIDAPVIISEVVNFEWEFRAHCILGRVGTIAPYISPLQAGDTERRQAEEDARGFTQRVLDEHGHRLPSAVVLDVGKLDTGKWAVVEANQAYASGIYDGANMPIVLAAILGSAGPLADVREGDRQFLRPRIEVEL